MKDPCRICGVRLVGGQCRWIFSLSGKRKLQVILSHVLGREVIRDGRGEFLCGKCVFQLEKVVQFDININQLQDEHNSKIQKLQTEKEHLIQCIVHVYSRNNPGSSARGSTRSKTPLRACEVGSPDVEAACQPPHEGLLFRERGSVDGENRIRRCVSLDRIVSKGALSGRIGLRSSRLGSGAGLDGCMRNYGLSGTRHRSQSMYLDLVQRKGTPSRQGFKSHSTSLQSLNKDFSSDQPPDTQCKRKLWDSKLPVSLLRCISKHQVSAPSGSRIPVLKRLNAGSVITRAKLRNREAEWKSLHNLAEEFNDEYTPVKEYINMVRDLEQSKSPSSNDSMLTKLRQRLKEKESALEEMADKLLNQSQTHARDLAEQMGQRLKVTETMLSEAVKARERLIVDNESAVEGLLATISSKDHLLKKLLQRGQERDRFLAEMSQKAEADHVLELRQTIQIMQEKLDDREDANHGLFLISSRFSISALDRGVEAELILLKII
ncbi:hypothetical protein XENOCAPTIV_004297 [Xenoophorus captivus]|uniref:Short myomegalin-like EB1 binding protein N-terminal domain-containing protein n=1 Tax=Xenoophorus captivus TaxID=1517983 RepID=A0ABV0Q4I4_9TELE